MSKQRLFSPENFYHVINRGNNKQKVFLVRKDYLKYLNYLEKYSNKFQIKINVYCLMPNHIHILVSTGLTPNVSDFMQALNTAYTKYFNSRHSVSGHLFEGPFRHVWVETDEYLVHLSRYIHLNPTSAGLTKKPEDYEWSSYKHYLVNKSVGFVEKKTLLKYFSNKNPVKDYRDFVNSRVDYQKEISLQKLLLEKV